MTTALDAEAEAYCASHALEEHLSAAVDLAIQQKSDNPLLLISRYLAEKAGGDSSGEATNGTAVAPPVAAAAPPKAANGGSLVSGVHINARSETVPAYEGRRFPVPDEAVPWSVPMPGYAPQHWTADSVKKNARGLETGHGWADPDEVGELREELSARTTFATEGGEPRAMGDAVSWDAATSAPLNPSGRTGLAGRGLLGKWGANHAADPIVTRFHPTAGHLQVVSIQRKDTGLWALPGGMVDPGENVTVTVRREFSEEAGELTDPAERARFEALTSELFASGVQVYRGYCDDPRNTDHAWMETTAFHFHCTEEVGAMLPLEAGDDAGKVMWLDVSVANERYCNLFASHRAQIDRAIFQAWERAAFPLRIVKAATEAAAEAEEEAEAAEAAVDAPEA